MNPVVTIITPTKNRLTLLCQTMDSVQQQTFDRWEHLVVDDGSDDGTAEEVARRGTADQRIRYIKRTNGTAGACVCRNLGVRESRSDLIVFLDSDDLLRPQCLERRVEIMQRNAGLDFCVFRAALFSKSVGDLKRLWHPLNPGDDLLRFLGHEVIWDVSGPIWRRSFLEKIGCFDETLRCLQDMEIHARALISRPKYLCFPDIDHDIRYVDDARKISSRYWCDPTYFEVLENVRAKLFDSLTRNGLNTWSRRRALLGLSFMAAESWVRAKRVYRAMRLWTRACSQQQAPSHVKIGGLGMICAARLGTRWGSVGLRLVNRWKGWVRFRQEPQR
jgi:glycosyltransferase involved in cell wall biosynthesis